MSIEDLRKQIERLKIRIQELKNEKETLQTNLRQRGQEMDSEKERVKTLEKEIATLKEEKAEMKKILHNEEMKHQARVTNLERRVDWLEKGGALAFKDNKIKQQEVQKERMQTHYEKTLESVLTRIGHLEDQANERNNRYEVQQAKLETLRDEFDKYKEKTDKLVESRNLICISQLFGKWMVAIYLKILREYFPVDEEGNLNTKYPQPHLGNIEKEINALYPNDEKKRGELKCSWRKVKEDMGFDYVNCSMDEDRRSQFMESTYWTILPEYFYGEDGQRQTKSEKPCHNDIENHIKSTYSDEEKRNEKMSKWKKTLEGLGSKIVEFAEKKMYQRNLKAHPDPLEEEELLEIAETMPYQHKLYIEQVIRQMKIDYQEIWNEHFIPVN